MRDQKKIANQNLHSKEDAVEGKDIELSDYNILVAETNSRIKQLILDHVSLNDCQANCASNCDQLTQQLILNNYDALFLSEAFVGVANSNAQIKLVTKKLAALVKRVKAVSSQTKVIVVATKGETTLPVELLKAGIDDYLSVALGEQRFIASISASLKYLKQKHFVLNQHTGKNGSKDLVAAPDQEHLLNQIGSFNRLVRNLPGSVLVTDDTLKILFANRTCERMLGFDNQLLKDISFKQLLPKKLYHEFCLGLTDSALHSNQKIVEKMLETVVLTQKGDGIPVQCIIKPLRIETFSGYSISLQDISSSLDYKASQIVLLKWQQLLSSFSQKFITLPVKEFPSLIKALLNQSALLLMSDRVYMYRLNKASSNAYLSYEWTRDKSLSLRTFSKELCVNENTVELNQLLEGRSLLLSPQHIVRKTLLSQSLGLSEHLAQVKCESSFVIPLRSKGHTYGWIGFDIQRQNAHWQANDIQNLTELAEVINRAIVRKKYEEMRYLTHLKLIETHGRLSEQACLDGLTQIANRRYFDQILQSEIGRAAREKSYLSIILCDIDYFKEYNDAYGHLAGDKCLKQVADNLLSSFKRAADFVARYGGEEFVVILPGLDCRGAYEAAEKMRSRLYAQNITHSSSPLKRISISVGLTCIQTPSMGCASELIERADRALYRAKYRGKNRVFIYEQRGRSVTLS